MADATVSQGRREETLAATEPAARIAPNIALPPALPFVLLWTAFVGGVAAFLVFGTVRVGAGTWFGWRMSVRQIWSRFISFLTDQGATAGVIFAVSAAAAVTLIGCAVVLWLAFMLRDSPGEKPSSDIPEQ